MKNTKSKKKHTLLLRCGWLRDFCAALEKGNANQGCQLQSTWTRSIKLLMKKSDSTKQSSEYNTGCFYSMTLFQQALKGAFFKISTCDLLQIVGTEKGIFFIYDAWRYTKNCGFASDLKNSSENRKHLVLYKMYTYLQLWCFDFFGYKLS